MCKYGYNGNALCSYVWFMHFSLAGSTGREGWIKERKKERFGKRRENKRGTTGRGERKEEEIGEEENKILKGMTITKEKGKIRV